MPLRTVFCGTPSFAVPALKALIAEADVDVAAVVTQPDRPRGRGNEISVSPVKAAAIEAGIEVFQPERVRAPESYDFFERVAPDCVVIIAYGQIIPEKLIVLPRLGWINVHASLLPKYRGAAPIPWAIVNGETLTGLTTMQIDAGLDTGPMLLKTQLPIGPDETAPQLTARLSEAGAPLIVQTLYRLEHGQLTPQPQDNSQATHARSLEKKDGLIDWQLSAPAIYNRIRGLQPWPGAFTHFRGSKCQIWGRPVAFEEFEKHSPKSDAAGIELQNRSLAAGTLLPGQFELHVACGEGSLLIESVQFEGRKRVTAREFFNGARLVSGERFD